MTEACLDCRLPSRNVLGTSGVSDYNNYRSGFLTKFVWRRASKRGRAIMQRSQTSSDVPTVFVVDPDPSTGAMAKSLLDGSDLACESFTNGHDFLEAFDAARPACI